jgi:uncharacterized protein (TIGR03435 family)
MKHQFRRDWVIELLVAACLAATIGQAQTPMARTQFEVASIKPHPGIGNLVHIQPLPGGRLVVENFSLRLLAQTAYSVQAFQISGGPAWINSERYDIQAKADGNASGKQMIGPMLQTLLEDRFKLSLHRETKLLPAYELTVAKGGAKLQHSKEGGCTPFSMDSPQLPPMRVPGEPGSTFCGFLGFGVEGLSRKLEMAGVSMAELATSLSRGQLQRPVIDKTGLGGTFDIKLRWTIDSVQASPGVAGDPAPLPAESETGPSLFSAIQEQLGLKLESTKGPVQILVIDHVERPSSN